MDQPRDAADASHRGQEVTQQLLSAESEGLESVLEAMDETIPAVFSLFEIGVGDPESLNAILDQGKGALVIVTLQTIEENVKRDTLTSLASRAHLNAVLFQEFEQSTRLGKPLSITFCDVDQIQDNQRYLWSSRRR